MSGVEAFGGYGPSFASHYGQFVVENSWLRREMRVWGMSLGTTFVAAAGFWPRTQTCDLASNFVTYNDTEQERRPQIPLYAGAFSAGLISSTWKPDNRIAWKDGPCGTGAGGLREWR